MKSKQKITSKHTHTHTKKTNHSVHKKNYRNETKWFTLKYARDV